MHRLQRVARGARGGGELIESQTSPVRPQRHPFVEVVPRDRHGQREEAVVNCIQESVACLAAVSVLCEVSGPFADLFSFLIHSLASQIIFSGAMIMGARKNQTNGCWIAERVMVIDRAGYFCGDEVNFRARFTELKKQ